MPSFFSWNPGLDARIRRAAMAATNAMAITLQTVIKQGFKGASNRSNPNAKPSPIGSPPAVMTGTLRRSIQVDPATDPNKIEARIGTRIIYARIHEFGGIIAAKGKYLTIPLTKEAVRASQNGGGARSMELSFQRSKKGQAMLVDDKGKPHWLLVRSVRMPARPFFRPGLIKGKQRALDAGQRALSRSIAA